MCASALISGLCLIFLPCSCLLHPHRSCFSHSLIRATHPLTCPTAQGILSSFFYKYADTILKKYSSTIATIFTALMSWALFGHALTVNFLLGVSIVLISMHQVSALCAYMLACEGMVEGTVQSGCRCSFSHARPPTCFLYESRTQT